MLIAKTSKIIGFAGLALTAGSAFAAAKGTRRVAQNGSSATAQVAPAPETTAALQREEESSERFGHADITLGAFHVDDKHRDYTKFQAGASGGYRVLRNLDVSLGLRYASLMSESQKYGGTTYSVSAALWQVLPNISGVVNLGPVDVALGANFGWAIMNARIRASKDGESMSESYSESRLAGGPRLSVGIRVTDYLRINLGADYLFIKDSEDLISADTGLSILF